MPKLAALAPLAGLAALALLLSAALAAPATIPATPAAPATQNAPKPGPVELTGKIAAGVMAIGAETTGYTLSNNTGTFELALSDAQKATADKLDGKQAKVKGTLEIKPGVEVRQRKIITVTSIEEVK